MGMYAVGDVLYCGDSPVGSVPWVTYCECAWEIGERGREEEVEGENLTITTCLECRGGFGPRFFGECGGVLDFCLSLLDCALDFGLSLLDFSLALAFAPFSLLRLRFLGD